MWLLASDAQMPSLLLALLQNLLTQWQPLFRPRRYSQSNLPPIVRQSHLDSGLFDRIRYPVKSTSRPICPGVLDVTGSAMSDQNSHEKTSPEPGMESSFADASASSTGSLDSIRPKKGYNITAAIKPAKEMWSSLTSPLTKRGLIFPAVSSSDH